MKKSFLFIFLFLVQLNLFSADHTVKMLNQGTTGIMVFEPAFLKINLGDTVTFESTDAAHNSASIPGMLPEGASSWNGELSRDLSVTFDIPGVYGYQCTPHSMMAMVGVIQVTDGMELDMSLDSAYVEAADTFAKTYKSKFVMNNQRLDNYMNELLSKFFE